MVKKINLVLVLSLILFSFSLVAAENIGTFKIDEEMQITNYCSSADCTYMNLSSYTYPNGTLVYLNEEMTKNGQEFNYSFIPRTLGEYNFKTCANPIGQDNCDSDYFYVSSNGEVKDNMQLFSRIFLIFLSILLVIVIQRNSKNVNYDKWYNQIAEKYRTKNTFRWVLSAVGYNIFKNSYIFSYLVGLLGFLVLTETAVFFNITSVISILKIVLGLYTWGALAVVIVFFSQVQEWIMEWKEDLQKINWGELTSIK